MIRAAILALLLLTAPSAGVAEETVVVTSVGKMCYIFKVRELLEEHPHQRGED